MSESVAELKARVEVLELRVDQSLQQLRLDLRRGGQSSAGYQVVSSAGEDLLPALSAPTATITCLPRRFLRFLILQFVCVSIYSAGHCQAGTEQRELGKLVGGLDSVWRRGSQSQGLPFLLTCQTPSTWCSKQKALSPQWWSRGQQITERWCKISKAHHCLTASPRRLRPKSTAWVLEWSFPQGCLNGVHSGNESSRRHRRALCVLLASHRYRSRRKPLLCGNGCYETRRRFPLGGSCWLLSNGRVAGSIYWRRRGRNRTPHSFDSARHFSARRGVGSCRHGRGGASCGFVRWGISGRSAGIGYGADISLGPDPATLLKFALEWVRISSSQCMVFFSAEEEAQPPDTAAPKPPVKAKAKRPSVAQQTAEHISAMAKLMPTMAQQIAELQRAQLELQETVRGQAAVPAPRPSQMPVSMSPQQFVSILGSPPKVKGVPPAPPPKKRGAINMDSHLTVQEQAEEDAEETQVVSNDPLAAAMLEQSRALTALVSHIQQGDPLIDGHASGTSVSSRGAQGRERLQRDLTNRTGGYFLTVMQNMHRRMKPASQVPTSLDELAMTDLSMVSYLERFGGYGGVRDMGIAQYALAFIVDMAMRGDLVGVQEHLALLVVGMEQYAQDGKWDLLTLLEDPPPQMWSYRNPVGVQTGRLRAFAPLCPQKWATISLAYLKEIDFIQNRRTEVAKKDAAAASPKPLQPSQSPPKKKGGKGTKGKPSSQHQQEPLEEGR